MLLACLFKCVSVAGILVYLFGCLFAYSCIRLHFCLCLVIAICLLTQQCAVRFSLTAQRFDTTTPRRKAIMSKLDIFI